MLIWLVEWLSVLAEEPLTLLPVLRGVCASLLALGSVLILGNRAIAWLSRRFREPIKSDSATLARLHAHKRSTPTMGGILVLGSLLVALLFFADLSNRWLQIAVLLCGGFAVIGAFDDWVKLSTARPGMTVKGKLFAQFVVSSLAFLLFETAEPSRLTALGVWIPGVHHVGQLGLWSLPAAVLVVVGSANAVNLTDGLDGLASGCLAMSFGMMAVLSFIAGNSEWANFTGLPSDGHASEMAILSAAACGAVLGFLWFNWHPARVFMGNTGALPLGALLGLIAVAAQLQLALVLIGIVFVAETLSVMLQVASFKLTGKRVFRCAPLHHHFQFLGWSERRTVTRFWFAGAVAAVCTLVGLGIEAISNTSDAIQFAAGIATHDSAER